MNDNGGLVRKRERPHEGGRNSRPTRSSRYELLVKIGSGATATVYVARRSAATSGSSQFSRLVAVKRAHPHLVDDAAARRTLLEEARMASGIHHANVAVEGDEPNPFAKVVSYVPATGVMTIKLYTNAAGTIAAADTTGKVYRLFAVCVRNVVAGVI